MSDIHPWHSNDKTDKNSDLKHAVLAVISFKGLSTEGEEGRWVCTEAAPWIGLSGLGEKSWGLLLKGSAFRTLFKT